MLKVTFQLLQNLGYFPCVVQYMLERILTPNSLYLSLPYIAPPLHTGNN